MGITGKIYGINGPVITIQGNLGYKMNEMVYVGEHRLVGEVIRLSKEKTTIQVYEETSGLKPGEEVAGAGCAISVKLAPGILNNIFDGIERPLQKIAEKAERLSQRERRQMHWIGRNYGRRISPYRKVTRWQGVLS